MIINYSNATGLNMTSKPILHFFNSHLEEQQDTVYTPQTASVWEAK